MNSGIFLALVAYAVYACGDGMIKGLGGQLSIFEIGFFNILFAMFFMFAFRTPPGEQWRHFWRMKRPWAVHARAISGLVAGILGVYAFTTIPLAEVYALIFVAPLFVTLLSIIFLKEQVGPWRWFALIAGFVGVLLVVRPGFRELQLGHFAALAVALLAATTIILMRSLAGEKQTTMLGVLVGYTLVFNGLGGGRHIVHAAALAHSGRTGADRRLHRDRPSPAASGRPPGAGQSHRADALFADDLGRHHRRELLQRVSRPAFARRSCRHSRLRPADAGARADQAGHRALEPVFPQQALSRLANGRTSRP